MLLSAFNTYAEEYDTHFTGSPIGMMLRQRVYKYLNPLLTPGKTVLEINCGTGADAIYMAPFVKKVIATDLSNGMIEVARKKAGRSGLNNIEFSVADTRKVHDHFHEEADLLLSDFGGLNCLTPPELRSFSRNISIRMKSGSKMVLVIMGKRCLWENLLFIKQKDKRLGRRNTTGGVATEINGSSFLTYYYSPAEIAAHFSEHFKPVVIRPIGLFIPPSYMNPYFTNKKRTLTFLNALEKICGNWGFTGNFADHFLVILEKRRT